MSKSTKKFNHCEKLNANPLMCVIVGATGSGKTHLLFNMLTTEGILDFDNLIIYTPTNMQPYFQLLLHGFNNNLNKTTINTLYQLYEEDVCSVDDIPELVREAATNKDNLSTKPVSVLLTDKADFASNLKCNSGSNRTPAATANKKTIVVFDDCVTNKNQEVQKEYFIKGRHSNCHCIYLTQSFYGLDKDFIRKNANVYILFSQSDRNLTAILQDIDIGMDKNAFKQMANKQWYDPQEYKYILINTRKPRDCRCFDTVFDE